MKYPKEWPGLVCSCGLLWELTDIPHVESDGLLILTLYDIKLGARGYDYEDLPAHNFVALTPAARDMLEMVDEL